MTTEQINKAIRFAEKYKLGWMQFATKLIDEPFNLTAADATKVLDEYKRKNPASAYSNGLVRLECEVIPTVVVPAKKEKKTRKKHEHTPSALVRASAKDFALTVSEKKKNGKFRRAAKSFLQSVEADLENIVRDIGPRNPHSDDDIPGDWDFVNHIRIWPKLAEQLNRAIRRRIFERVMSQPSKGKTLQ